MSELKEHSPNDVITIGRGLGTAIELNQQQLPVLQNDIFVFILPVLIDSAISNKISILKLKSLDFDFQWCQMRATAINGGLVTIYLLSNYLGPDFTTSYCTC